MFDLFHLYSFQFRFGSLSRNINDVRCDVVPAGKKFTREFLKRKDEGTHCGRKLHLVSSSTSHKVYFLFGCQAECTAKGKGRESKRQSSWCILVAGPGKKESLVTNFHLLRTAYHQIKYFQVAFFLLFFSLKQGTKFLAILSMVRFTL